MNNETKNKFAAMVAAQQAKATAKTNTAKEAIKPKEATPSKVEVVAQPQKIEPATAPAMLKEFKILWHEGSGKFDGQTFDKWHTADKAMIGIYNEHKGEGYLKTKIKVIWENGQQIEMRADCSDSLSDFSPRRETIGEYLKQLHTERTDLSFCDDDNKEQLRKEIETPPQATASKTPELSQMTFADLFNDPKPQICAPIQTTEQSPLKIVDYSDRSFAIVTATKPSEEILNILRQHGSYNANLKCGKGWIFSKRHLQTLKQKLGLKG